MAGSVGRSGLRIAGGIQASQGTLYCGGFDPVVEMLYLGPAGHPDGMCAAGGRPRPSETPGITVLETASTVFWVNDSHSLTLPALDERQESLIQAAFAAYFPSKIVRRVPVIHDRLSSLP